ncbi:MAG: NAD(P)H-dependent glycerol-3-phosphate dehydrogenase [Marinovum sp.]|nr:NAD(P)H-dependent glycerol-3-phosphate dehydrogenase [Marinovum sp.]
MSIQISIIGQGAFGHALNAVYRAADMPVDHFGRRFPKDTPGEFIFLAVPTSSLKDVLERLRPGKEQVLVLCCKGILPSGEMPSSCVPDLHNWAVLSGPGFADELAQGLPTVHSLATHSGQAATFAEQLSTKSLRLYWSDDPDGTQVCGAFKNVLAIAAGIADGLGLGENARAALLVRGAAELRHVITHWGGREDTIWSPAGLGDLSLTCNSPKSRNFRFGQMLAAQSDVGDALARLGTVEGLHSISGLRDVMHTLDLPITRALMAVVDGNISPADAVATLMMRATKPA